MQQVLKVLGLYSIYLLVPSLETSLINFLITNFTKVKNKVFNLLTVVSKSCLTVFVTRSSILVQDGKQFFSRYLQVGFLVVSSYRGTGHLVLKSQACLDNWVNWHVNAFWEQANVSWMICVLLLLSLCMVSANFSIYCWNTSILPGFGHSWESINTFYGWRFTYLYTMLFGGASSMWLVTSIILKISFSRLWTILGFIDSGVHILITMEFHWV